MLNYTTTTLVNDPANVVAIAPEGSDLKKFRVKFAPDLWNDANHTPCLLKKQEYTAAVPAKAEVTLANETGTIYRVAIYIRLRNQNNPYFSNDWTFKGKPLFVEYTGNASDAKIAETVARLAKKYALAQYGYDLVKFEGANDKLTITAHDQWEIFLDQDNRPGVHLERLATVDMAGKEVAEGTAPASPTHEEFVFAADATVNNGNEAFGDFAHIVKDLRLPSAANLRWQGPHQGDVMGGEPNDDKPLPTGKYTQYTIQYDAERGILQQTALGGLATSRTIHVFYVESAAVSAFDAALTAAGITDNGHVHKTEASISENVAKAAKKA